MPQRKKGIPGRGQRKCPNPEECVQGGILSVIGPQGTRGGAAGGAPGEAGGAN